MGTAAKGTTTAAELEMTERVEGVEGQAAGAVGVATAEGEDRAAEGEVKMTGEGMVTDMVMVTETITAMEEGTVTTS
jgi:hypothetical protein